ncbi:MAG TPA: GNAT family N-acetyltransferase, partial [Acidimicrobiales bacterium]
MPTSADTAATALIRTLQYLISASPNGWTSGSNGVMAAVTGVAIPTLNGVWTESANADPRTTGQLLDQVATTGLPYCLQVRPDASSELSEIASTRGMSRDDHPIPLMALDGADRHGAWGQADGLQIRELDLDEVAAHAQVAAAGFEAPVEVMLQLMTPSVMSLPGVHCYLGEVDGRPVTTGLGVVINASVGIFNIATPPECRRRGYGAALTARVIEDAFRAGATLAWLQSSAQGFAIYEALGFRTV